MTDPRRIIIELAPDASAALDSISTQTGDNLSFVVNYALNAYAALRGMRDEDGKVTIKGWDGRNAIMTIK